MSTAAYLPSTYTLPRMVKSTDTTKLLYIEFLPCILIPCFVGFCAVGLSAGDESCWSSTTSTRSRIRQTFFFIISIIFFSLSIGFMKVHTQYEEQRDYYNLVANYWIGYQNRGQKNLFSEHVSMNLSNYNYYNVEKDVAVLQRKVVPIKTNVNDVDDDSDVGIIQTDSVYFETNISRDKIYNIRTLRTQIVNVDVANNNKYNYPIQNSNIGPFIQNNTQRDTIYCSSSFCTTGCTSKRKYSNAKCSIGTSSPVRKYCESLGGRFIPSSVAASTLECKYGSSCGTCTYQNYLEGVGIFVLRSTTSPTYYQYSSSYKGLTFPYRTQNFVAKPNYRPNPYITVRVYNIQDPKLTLDLLTVGTDKFPKSSHSYRVKGRWFIALGFICLFASILLYFYNERSCCFSQGSSLRTFIASALDEETTLFDTTTAATSTGRNNNTYNYNAAATSTGSLQQSETSVASLDPNIVCQICYAKPRDCKFTPCLHHMCCKSCAQQIQNSSAPHCPLCRTYISGIEDCSPQEPTYAVFQPSNSGSSSGSSGNSGDYSASASSSSERNMFCQICLSSYRDQKFNPCNHHVCCSSCAQLLVDRSLTCPICRTTITSYTYVSPDEPTFVRFS